VFKVTFKKNLHLKFYIAGTLGRTGNAESSALIASSVIEGANSIKMVMEPLKTVSK
jgi:hypothetical protein